MLIHSRFHMRKSLLNDFSLNLRKSASRILGLIVTFIALIAVHAAAAEAAVISSATSSSAPHINGPSVFGVRPDSPVLYKIPATGETPMQFSIEGLPKGLQVDAASGQITGVLHDQGDYILKLCATNSQGGTAKNFRIIVGENIALTPPMGWNSWNCWAESVDQEKVLRAARAMVASGLINHGWTYINIDDTWQGKRTGKDHALQGNQKFPDLKALCRDIHGMGLKVGIYSTPWITSYAKCPGGSSDQADGTWPESLASSHWNRHGEYSFAGADANQWAEWGIDYLKYDWNPIDRAHVVEMSKALRKSGRDIIFSLSNAAPFDQAADWAQWANCWRTTGDIWDYWDQSDAYWRYPVSAIAFNQDRWAPYAGPGHWNDPDMLVVGYVGWGSQLHLTHLTPDEQYLHISMWCMLSAPLLIGCDMERLDPFTLDLLSNDEVIALDQDALGKPATRAATEGAVDVYLKDLEDGSKAIGFFNRGQTSMGIAFNRLKPLGFRGRLQVRDLWEHQNLADVTNAATYRLTTTIPGHGVRLFKVTSLK